MHSLNLAHLLQYATRKSGIALPVTITYQNQSADIEVKLDTGASYCIFERFYGEELGITVEDGERLEFSTANGTFTAFGHAVVLSVVGIDFEILAYFAKDPRFNRNVLGRNGFLHRVLLGLDDYAGKLYLSPNT